MEIPTPAQQQDEASGAHNDNLLPVTENTARIDVLLPPRQHALLTAHKALYPFQAGPVVFSTGVAKYTCTFLVISMPDLGYVLGADFLAYYDGSKQWRTELGLESDPGQCLICCEAEIQALPD